jgi:hypothetical protein
MNSSLFLDLDVDDIPWSLQQSTSRKNGIRLTANSNNTSEVPRGATDNGCVPFKFKISGGSEDSI